MRNQCALCDLEYAVESPWSTESRTARFDEIELLFEELEQVQHWSQRAKSRVLSSRLCAYRRGETFGFLMQWRRVNCLSKELLYIGMAQAHGPHFAKY